MRLLAIIMLFAAGHSVAQQASVGGGANCDFNDLQQAVDSVGTGATLRINLNGRSVETYLLSEPVDVHNRNITFSGGYQGCGGSVNLNDRSLLRSTAPLETEGRLFNFTSGLGVNTDILFQDITLSGGHATTGGAMRIAGGADVRIIRSELVANLADSGGAIHLDGSFGASVQIQEGTRLFSNTAARGGAIHCRNAQVGIGRSTFEENRADIMAGALYLDDCNVTSLEPGVVEFISNRADDRLLSEFSRNSDSELDGTSVGIVGGAVVAFGGTTINLGNRGSKIVFRQNLAFVKDRYKDIWGRGGAIFATGSGTSVNLINGHIVSNTAEQGAGVFATDNASFSLMASTPACTNSEPLGCATMDNNIARGTSDGFFGCISTANSFAGQGGALYLGNGAAGMLNGVFVKRSKITRVDGCAFENERQYAAGAAFYIATTASLDFFNSVLTDTTRDFDSGGTDAEAIMAAGRFSNVHSTLAGNSSSFAALIRAGSNSARIEHVNSIVVEAGDLFDPSRIGNDYNPEVLVECAYVSSLAQIADTPGTSSLLGNIVEGASPGFVDIGSDNLRLVRSGEAVDLCTDQGITRRNLNSLMLEDFDAEVRPVFINANPSTPYDAGAFEQQEGLVSTPVDLAVTLSDRFQSYGINQRLGYHLNLANLTNTAVPGGTIVDIALDPQVTLPVSFFVNASQWSCTQSGHLVTCEALQTIAANSDYVASALLTFTGVDQPTTIVSTATLTPPISYVDIESGNNEVSRTTTIAETADLAIFTTLAPSSAQHGEVVEVAMQVQNGGPDHAAYPTLYFKLENGGDSLSVLETAEGWACVVTADFTDGQKPLVRCTASSGSIPMGNSDFVFSARAPVATTESTFDISYRIETTSQDNNDIYDSGSLAISLTDAPQAPNMLFSDSFE